MKYDFTKTLLNMKNEKIKEADGQEATVLTICQNALLSNHESERNIGGKERYDRYKLAQKIEGYDCELTVEEASKIKELVGQMYLPLIVGRVYEFFENTAS